MTGRLWRCVECEEPFHEGFACMACEQPVCRNCVRDEKHGCIDTGRRAWEEAMDPTALILIVLSGAVIDGDRDDLREQELRLRIAEQVRDIESRARSERERMARAFKSRERDLAEQRAAEVESRLRQIRKKHPWLAEEMGIAKKRNLPGTCFVCRQRFPDLAKHVREEHRE
jgi:hypothetical protein